MTSTAVQVDEKIPVGIAPGVAPTGAIVEFLIELPNGEEVSVVSRDYDWNHTCHCLYLSAEEVAILVACKVLGFNPPCEIKNRLPNLPDLGREHVQFEVDEQHYDFSLFGMNPTRLRQD